MKDARLEKSEDKENNSTNTSRIQERKRIREQQECVKYSFCFFFVLLLIGLPLYFVGYDENLQPFLFDYHKENGTVVAYYAVNDDGLSTGSILEFSYNQYGKLKLCNGPLYNTYKNNRTPHYFPLNSHHDIYVRNGYDGICYVEYPLKCYATAGFVILCIFIFCCLFCCLSGHCVFLFCTPEQPKPQKKPNVEPKKECLNVKPTQESKV